MEIVKLCLWIALGVIFVAVTLSPALPPWRARTWARKNGYRFVKASAWHFVPDGAVTDDDDAGCYFFIVENEKGRWRTAVTRGFTVSWVDEREGQGVHGSEHGWRSPDEE